VASNVEREVIGALQAPTGNLNVTAAVSLAGGNIAVTGRKIVVAIMNETTRTVSSVADAASTTYTIVGTSAGGSGSRVDIYEGTVAANNAGQSVTVTLSGNSADSLQVGVFEVSGLNTDQSGAQNANDTTTGATTHTSSSLTPPNASSLMIAAISRSSGIYTEDTDFTSVATGSFRTFLGYIENPVGAQTISYTSEDAESATIKTTILAGAASGTAVPVFMNHLKTQGIA
jgi:hypothetical protein